MYASHLKGGEITWQCLGATAGANSGKYIFQLKLYRDCTGVLLGPLPSSPIQVYGHPTLTTITCNFISNTDLTPAGCGVTCATAAFGNYQAVEEFIFRSAPITISGVPPSTGWIFYWDDICCRNNVDNVTGEVNMIIRSKMFAYNGLDANPCYDSSPSFAERPTTFLCIGYPYNYNNAAFDADFDDQQYGWDYALDGNGWANAVPLNFVAPYSVSNPYPGNPTLNNCKWSVFFPPTTR